MNAAIYARYSSDKQRSESIGQQIDACREYAARHGFTVVDIYSDSALSGRTDQRPEFLRMVDDCSRFDAVIVYKLDRFARDRYDAAMYRKILRDNGCQLISAMENIPDTPEGRLLESVIEGVAEWYSADLSQKVLRGMTDNARQCKANGIRVYGYDIAPDGTYTPNETESAVVQSVFDAWNGGQTLQEIADGLEGVRRLRGWFTTSSVSRMLKDERYIGVYRWRDIVIENGMPAIIAPSVFQAAQRTARKPRKANRKIDYPLCGKLFDHETGLPYAGYSVRNHSGKLYRYYAINKKGCPRITVPADAIESAVTRAVDKAFKDIAFVDAVCDEIAAREKELNVGKVQTAQKKLEHIESAELRLADAVCAGLSQPVFEKKMRELSRERAVQLEALALAKTALDPSDVRAFLEDITAHYTPDELFDELVFRVLVDRETRQIVLTLPLQNRGKVRQSLKGWTDCLEMTNYAAPYFVIEDLACIVEQI